MRLNGSAMYSVTFGVHQGQIFLGLPPWCSGLKAYTLQAGGGARIQPHSPGSSPAHGKKLKVCIKMRILVSGSLGLAEGG